MMLELLAQVEPLSLPLWAVLVFSAAMYPVGFLFGACSDCCATCQPCSRCNQPYNYEDDPCTEPPDSIGLTTAYGSANYTPDASGNLIKTTIRGIIPLTEKVPCVDSEQSEDVEVFIGMRLTRFRSTGTLDECDCAQCFYYVEYEVGVAEYGTGPAPPGQPRVPYELFVLPASNPETSFIYDKCSQVSKTIPLTITHDAGTIPQELEGACDGVTDLIASFNSAAVSIQFDLDDQTCECGACCRDGECSKNESQKACEELIGFGGVWQGVGAECDPNPCPTMGACCGEFGDCYEATEVQCDADGGTWHEGPCEPSPC